MTGRSGPPRQHRLRDFRSHDPAAGVWWQRGADFTGPHSVIAFIVAVALVGVIGVAFDPLSITTEFDLPEVQQAAYDEVYDVAYEQGRQRGIEQGHRERLVQLGLEHADRDAPWVRGVHEGWNAGWNSALDELAKATRASAPEDERLRELELLAGIGRR